MAKALFDVVQSGVVKININETHPLRMCPKALRDLEARKTPGSTAQHLDERLRGSGVQSHLHLRYRTFSHGLH